MLDKTRRIQAAEQFVDQHFTNVLAVFLAGSTARGEQKAQSDIDLLVITEEKPTYNRKCIREDGVDYELFVYEETSFYIYLSSECMIGNPSLARMCSESIIINGAEKAQQLKQHGEEMLREGMPELTQSQIDYMRYTVTDLLLDLEDCERQCEQMFIAQALMKEFTEFWLKVNGQWIGQGKWLSRALFQYDEKAANECCTSFQRFFETGDKHAIIDYVDMKLAVFGGRLFDGFEQ
ncbi:nucleotidyltransferase domain-containing protein [Bacillus tianshenii]|nr:nucleotidyltransferase domain-containing protein [Bacillus tianshenii]